jgi:hypothetical protein
MRAGFVLLPLVLLLSALPELSAEVATEKPPEKVWYSYVDETSKKVYYHNPATQETTWSLPEGDGVNVEVGPDDEDDEEDEAEAGDHPAANEEFGNDWSDEGFTSVLQADEVAENSEEAKVDLATSSVGPLGLPIEQQGDWFQSGFHTMQAIMLTVLTAVTACTVCLMCCTKPSTEEFVPENLEYLNVDCELSRRTTELKMCCDDFHEKALGLPKSVTIKEVADLHLKMKAMVKLMEPESERIKRQWETTQRQHSRVHPDSRRGKKLSDQLQKIQQRQQQYNRDCRLINSEMNKFQGSRLFKEAQVYTESARKNR